MFGTLGLPELLIILAIVILIFGVNKLPRLGKGLGEGIRNFKDSVKSGGTEADDATTNSNSETDTVEPK
jgi:sec-independent protein translocase protein TatA